VNAFGIFWQVIFPIFFIILIGALLERALTLDISTLTRINFYAFVPALVFVKMLQADLSLLTMGHIALFVLAHSALMLLIALLLYQHRMFQPYRKVLLLASMLTNAGNYGIPFVLLAFGDRYMSVAAVVLLVQNLLTFTVGVLLMESSQQQRMHILRAISVYPSSTRWLPLCCSMPFPSSCPNLWRFRWNTWRTLWFLSPSLHWAPSWARASGDRLSCLFRCRLRCAW
jgi:predicted permease